MIKHGGYMFTKELHEICNAIWRDGHAPQEWKKSILTVLHRKRSALECNNYRMISLMNHLGKALIMILTERLGSQTKDLIADEMAGFRQDRMTL
jgi:hypothetical protein